MGKARTFEKRLENFVEGFFARTFRSGLQPVELGRKLIREMERGKTVTPNGVVVANHYLVGLSEEDTERFGHFKDALAAELVQGLTEECAENSWQILGPIEVEFETHPELKIGRYVIESRIIESDEPVDQPAAVVPEPAAPPPVAAPAPAPAAAAPPAPANPRVVTNDGQEVALGDYSLRIGRLDDCNLIFDDHNVSRHHAEVRPAANGFQVADLGSTNGTYVNGKKIDAPTLLSDGDRVSVGRNTLTFRS